MREYEVHPEDFGLQMMSLRHLRVTNADESRATLLGALDNQPGPARDIVCLNAGAALYVANVADYRRRHRPGPRSHRQRCGAPSSINLFNVRSAWP